MSDSTFDPNQFLNSTTTEAAKRRQPLDPKHEYSGVIGEPKARTVQGKKDPSKSYTFIDFPIVIDLTANPSEHLRVGFDSVNLQFSGSFDVNDSGIDWSPGKNTTLRMLREATGQNIPGKAFRPNDLVGRTVRVKIRHEEYPEGSGELQDRIASVAKP